MPYYRITIFLKNSRKQLKGIRLIETQNPDTAFSMVQQIVHTKIRPVNILKIDVVMLPKQSEEVKRFLSGLKQNQNIYL